MHKKEEMLLAITISIILPLLSAYVCSTNSVETDALLNSLSLENPGRDSVFALPIFKDSSLILFQPPSLNLRATVLRC